MRSTLKRFSSMMALGFVALLSSCSPDESGSNGLTAGSLDASFTLTPKDGSPNRFIVTATNNTGVTVHLWNTGTGDVVGHSQDELFLPDVGTYVIRHTVGGIGGTKVSSEQTITVTTPDPIAGNMILGGKFDTADDIAKWSMFTIGAEGGANWTFENGMATTHTQAAWAQKGLYQTIQVVAGAQYKFDMKVKGQGGFDHAFFELYADYTPPTPGSDYSAGGKVLQINTWAGCGFNPFEGQMFALSCGNPGDTSGGYKTFPTDGTVYVVMRGGTEYATPGNQFSVSIDNVEVRRVQ